MFNTSTRWMFPHNSPIHSLTLQILGNYRCLRSLTEKTIDFTQNQGSPHSNGGPRPVARAAHVSVRQPVRGHEKKRTASGDQHWQWKSQLICTSQYIYINIFIYLFIYYYYYCYYVYIYIYINKYDHLEMEFDIRFHRNGIWTCLYFFFIEKCTENPIPMILAPFASCSDCCCEA